MQKYKIITYGCQMNVHESEKLAGILEIRGYAPCESIDEADIVVFNTCCVRDNAERRAMGNIGALKGLKRRKPSLIICVVGCMTQQKGVGEALCKKFPFVDIVLGTSNLGKLGEYIDTTVTTRKKCIEIDGSEKPEIVEDVPIKRTSGVNAWLNIMYGCDNFCSYCVVPYVRGRERSRASAAVIDDFKRLVDEGYKEITLLGQNVNSYGRGLDEKIDFTRLLEKLAAVGGKHRIRFMTSHPKDFNREVIDVVASQGNICNAVHLPIQSGSDKVLSLMNRRYTRDEYMDIVSAIRERMPHCGITSDLMVGFPCEEDEDFEATLDIVRRARFTNAFTFVYSPRRGTRAAEMPQVSADVSKARIMKLIEVQNAVAADISAEYVGNIYEVLVEDKSESGVPCGRTESGKLVVLEDCDASVGDFVETEITRAEGQSLFGRADI